MIWTGCNIFCYCSWGDRCCYHDSLLPDGEVPASHCQNNVFVEGRPLYRVHQPVMGSKAVEGLGTWERRERKSRGWYLTGWRFHRSNRAIHATFTHLCPLGTGRVHSPVTPPVVKYQPTMCNMCNIYIYAVNNCAIYTWLLNLCIL